MGVEYGKTLNAMDISKRLPDNLPANWDELQKEVRALLKKYDLKDVWMCVDMIDCERSDSLVEETLRPLLQQFSSIKRIHVYYDGDDVSYYRIWVETESDSKELMAIQEMQEKLDDAAGPGGSLEMNGWFEFMESEEEFRMHTYEGAQIAIIER